MEDVLRAAEEAAKAETLEESGVAPEGERVVAVEPDMDDSMVGPEPTATLPNAGVHAPQERKKEVSGHAKYEDI